MPDNLLGFLLTPPSHIRGLVRRLQALVWSELETEDSNMRWTVTRPDDVCVFVPCLQMWVFTKLAFITKMGLTPEEMFLLGFLFLILYFWQLLILI